MEPAEEGQAPVSLSVGSELLLSSQSDSPQVEYSSMFYPQPGTWVPQQSSVIVNFGQQTSAESSSPHVTNSYMTPMNVQPIQMEPSDAYTHYPGTEPTAPFRLSFRPQQWLNVPNAMPILSLSTSKKSPLGGASTKVHAAKNISNKRPAQKEQPLKVQPGSIESVRSKLRESLSAALSVDIIQSTQLPYDESSCDERQEDTVFCMSTSVLQITSESPCDHVLQSSCDKKAELSTDVEQLESKLASMEDGGHVVVADELLQGHGLCWASDIETVEPEKKRTKREATAQDKRMAVQKAESLALNIEAELFRLFGGVNKKYKEKGRSLLFNLKDKNNPDLRERVLSGDIAPERLCSMTAEELASKELSQWRMAKAEELAQMVVLPDTEVDVRRLVRKTHKGEYQVEVEQSDAPSVEIDLKSSVPSEMPEKSNGSQDVKSEDKVDPLLGPGKFGISTVTLTDKKDGALPDNMEVIVNEKTDLMQELMVDEIKDTENLPQIISLDEFMQSLDAEPPFHDLSVNGLHGDPESVAEDSDLMETDHDHRSGAKDSYRALEDTSRSNELSLQDQNFSKLDSPKDEHVARSSGTSDPSLRDHGVGGNAEDISSNGGPESKSANDEPPKSSSNFDLIDGSVWRGVIQLTVSSLANVTAVFRSGEKPSNTEWPSVIEIKGRVRLDAFEKFLQELPLSRSRAVMVTDICCQEDSDVDRTNMSQAIEAYIADERVGFIEPAAGVELYLCPASDKMIAMLAPILPKGRLPEDANLSACLLIGVVVWRRPPGSAPPRTSSHHRHNRPSRQHSASRSEQPPNQTNASKSSSSSMSRHSSAGWPASSANTHYDDDVTDDVPPGFGPRVGVPKDEDDLPEFDFVNTNTINPATSRPRPVTGSSAPARPMDQMRELIQRYGQDDAPRVLAVPLEPWNEDDDMPEWNSNLNLNQLQDKERQPLVPQQQLLPPPPPLPPLPPPPPMSMYGYQHQLQLPAVQANMLHQTYHHMPSEMRQNWQPNAWAMLPPAFGGGPVQRPNAGSSSNFLAAGQGNLNWRPNYYNGGRGV